MQSIQMLVSTSVPAVPSQLARLATVTARGQGWGVLFTAQEPHDFAGAELFVLGLQAFSGHALPLLAASRSGLP
jgi:hypothetical protein